MYPPEGKGADEIQFFFWAVNSNNKSVCEGARAQRRIKDGNLRGSKRESHEDAKEAMKAFFYS